MQGINLNFRGKSFNSQEKKKPKKGYEKYEGRELISPLQGGGREGGEFSPRVGGCFLNLHNGKGKHSLGDAESKKKRSESDL